MITISLCMIVKNEQDIIEQCLDSVKNCVDEIIIVDTGSTDNTVELIKKYTDKVFFFDWIDDFSAARNYSFSKATKDYILWLDADDVLMPEDQIKLMALRTSLSDFIDSVTMTYNYGFDEFGNPTLSFRRNRLVKRNRMFKWYGPVHEYLSVSGNIINSDVTVSHKRIHQKSGRNLSIFEKRLKNGENFSARDTYYYANELSDNGFLEKAIEYYDIFLNMNDGWIEDKISTCYKVANKYLNLGDLEKELEYIWKSFELTTPRAEFCCMLGYHFLNKKEYKKALFWYKLASDLEKPKENWGFFLDSCWTWLPHLQLCLCYYWLGDYKNSYEQNEAARSFRPMDDRILHNKKLLEGILNDDK
ncbi:glycosyltransferase [Clostridium chromiireducens]|uniref:Glycosyltransferase n=1 Tax=Clostridium chromiireducens TaxID=225345 RepID=A0A964W1D0_9CLOT|nr:glycosyltransferase [Clostridium chromiireducens]MVX63174.1 glycosyltransferase [Clostridium chromiireducens]